MKWLTKVCSLETSLKRYNLASDPALVLMGKIVHGADTDNTLWHQLEGPSQAEGMSK